MKIFLLEDDPILNRALTLLFTGNGFLVYPAKDGKEALDMIASRELLPDLILCDIMVPNISGPEFLTRLKTMLGKKSPAVVMMSGMKDAQALLAKQNIQYDYFLKKPFDLADMYNIFEEIRKKNAQ